VAIKIVKSAEHYTKAALEEIKVKNKFGIKLKFFSFWNTFAMPIQQIHLWRQEISIKNIV
jgi:hypothetical protein